MYRHWRHVSSLGTPASSASQPLALVDADLTAEIPRCTAHAAPAISTRSGVDGRLLRRGRSIRVIVLTGASFDQPRGTQYASNASHVVSSISVTHFVADT